LTLQITGRRPDGYHTLCSLVTFCDVGERITLTPAQNDSLEVVGPFAHLVGPADDNLAMKAARLLRQSAERDAMTHGFHIRIDKQIPVAAGLGGGSADAAAVLRATNNLWKLNRSVDRLQELGSALGADVPMCVTAQPAWIGGIGEVVEETALPAGLHLVLVNPGVSVPTGAVFGRLNLADNEINAAQKSDVATPEALLSTMRAVGNDLQIPASAEAPEIAEVLARLDKLPEVTFTGMSGSGATCFALFGDGPSAERSRHLLAADHPEWWIKSAPISPS